MPDGCGVAVVVFGQVGAEVVQSFGHRCWVTMERGLFRSQSGEDSGVHGGDLVCVQLAAEPFGQSGRSGKGPFDGDLLIEQHGDQESQWFVVDQILWSRGFGKADSHRTSVPGVGRNRFDDLIFAAGLLLTCLGLAACSGGVDSEAGGSGSTARAAVPTTAVPTAAVSTTAVPTTAAPTTTAPTTTVPTTAVPTTTSTTSVPSDQRTLEPVAELTGDLAAKSVVASGFGLTFAQNMMYRHTISVFNADKELVATIPDTVDLSAFGFDVPSSLSSGAPVEAAFSPDGRYGYVSNYRMYGDGFAGGGGDSCNKGAGEASYVYRIDTETLEIDAVYLVGSVPKFLAVTPDGERLLVSNWCTFDVTVIDLATGQTLTSVEVGRHPRGIAITSDSTTAYIAVMGSSDIAVIDLADFSLTQMEGVGSGPRHLILSPDDELLYVTLNGEGVVAKLDAGSGEELARVRTGQAPRSMAMAGDGASLYVVNYDSDTMTKVRASDFAILQEFSTADKPIGITFDVLRDEVWVSAYSGVIHVYAEVVP